MGAKVVVLRMRPKALKLHSIVFEGTTPRGRLVSFYVPRESLEELGVLQAPAFDHDVESLPSLDVSLAEAE